VNSAGHKMQNANRAMAHLFISNPFGGDGQKNKVSFFAKLFSTHPSTEERVAALRGLEIK
jgi:heat shock protein HtpX